MECKENDTLLLLSLHRISFLSLAEKLILLKKLDSFNDLALMSLNDINDVCHRIVRTASWNGKENLRFAERELKILQAKKIGYLLYSDGDYPALLRETPNAPFMLFYCGNFKCLAEKTVSVVGTRKITPEGKMASLKFCHDAADAGCTVISGLANGVDGAAHLGAVNAFFDSLENGCAAPNGKTAAVLPCGCDEIVPRSHARLAENILESGGCLLSEYVPGCPSENWRFVQRNRIIAGLSPATVVIEAPNGSGALLTAQFALEYNRDVMFHKAAFSENALTVRKFVCSELRIKAELKKGSKSKVENTIEKFIESGAPVIESYEDYCKCLAEMPGMRSVKNGQLDLFL